MKRQFLLMIFRIAFLILPTLPYGKLIAQPSLRFEHITSEEGLSDFHAIEIFQDSRDFMWFGTYNGLNRYDGYQIVQYKNVPGDSTSLSHPYVNALCEDQNGTIWVGTSDGLNRYDPGKDAFVRYYYDEQNDNSLSSNFVWALQLSLKAAGDLIQFKINHL